MAVSADPASPIRRRVLYTGRVQGVGFRYTVRSVASRFAVSGFVRNLPDGRVELVAEGTPAAVDGLQEAVAEAMAGHIADTSRSDAPATGEFSSFSIAF